MAMPGIQNQMNAISQQIGRDPFSQQYQSTQLSPGTQSYVPTQPTQPQSPQSPSAPQPFQPPINANLLNQILNSQNANARSTAVAQNDQAREQNAARGWGYGSPAETAKATLNQGFGQVASNNLNLPLQASQLNAQFGLSAGQLGEQERATAAQGQLGVLGASTDRYSALLKALGQI